MIEEEDIIATIRLYRKKYGLTQKDLSKKSGIQKPVIGRIETSKVDPRLSTILKLCEGLGLELEIKEGRDGNNNIDNRTW